MDFFRKICLLILFLNCTSYSLKSQNNIYPIGFRTYDNLSYFSTNTVSTSFSYLDSQHVSVGLSYDDIYRSGLHAFDLASAFKVAPRWTLLLSGYYFAAPNYSNMDLHIGATTLLGSHFYIGSTLDYTRTSFVGSVTEQSIDASLAMSYRLAPLMRIELGAYHIGQLGKSEALFNSLLSMRFHYDIQKNFSLIVAGEKNNYTSMTGRFICLFAPTRNLDITASYQFNPGSFSLGFTYRFQSLSISAMSYSHPSLPYSFASHLGYAH